MTVLAATKTNQRITGPESIVRSNELHPTEEAYSDLLTAYHHFNDRLFDSKLVTPLLTLARKPRMLGAFCAKRFQNKAGVAAHEIILNPYYLAQREDADSLSTLVHEMAHQWREDFGPAGRNGKKGSNGYHDKVWAGCMEAVGLMPSTTGLPGGKRTGARVSHFVIAEGPFDLACRDLLDGGFLIRWHDRVPPNPAPDGSGNSNAAPKRKDRVKFTCGGCDLNAWAKPTALLVCGACRRDLISPEATSFETDEA